MSTNNAFLDSILVGLDDNDLKMIENMETHGGSFVKALASLIKTADKPNYDLILRTWPDYIAEYYPNYQTKKLTK